MKDALVFLENHLTISGTDAATFKLWKP